PCIPPPDRSWTTSGLSISGDSPGWETGSYKNRAAWSGGDSPTIPPDYFRNAKNVSARVLLDRDPVIHLVDAHDLRIAAVGSELVVFAHDERLDRLGRTDLGAQPAEAAARQVEVKVVENFYLQTGLAVAAERNQIVRAGLRALVADDARLGAGGGLGLQTQDAAKTRRGRPALGRILKRERGLRRVLQRDPQPLQQVD